MAIEISNEALESYIKGMQKVSEILKKEDPDYIVFPMLGSIAFSDTLNVIDGDFPKEKSIYPPASMSRGMRDATGGWIYNFLDSINLKDPIKMIFVDEAKSGNCVRSLANLTEEVIKDYALDQISELKRFVFKKKDKEAIASGMADIDKKTKENYTSELAKISEKLQGENEEENKAGINTLSDILHKYFNKLVNFKTIAVEHDNGSYLKSRQVYDNLVNQGRVIPVKVNSIITMDVTDFTPARYKLKGPSSKKYLPEIDYIRVEEQYLNLLERIAGYVGTDISNMSFPINERKIMDSKNLLTRYYKKEK